MLAHELTLKTITVDVELKQISDDIMVMSWKPVASSDNLNYEAQVRLLSGQSQDFQQVCQYTKHLEI